MGELIFTKEELSRISEATNGSKKMLNVDVHGLTRNEAIRFLKNIVALNFRWPEYILQVIHGYIGGTVIKETLLEESISPRVNKVETCRWNPGITLLTVN